MEAEGMGSPTSRARNLTLVSYTREHQTLSQNRQGLILFRPTFTGWWSRKSSPGLGLSVCKRGRRKPPAWHGPGGHRDPLQGAHRAGVMATTLS